MIEPKLKKKNLINRIIKKQLFITLSTAFLLIFILVGSSYAILNGNTETGVTDVIVQSGNLTASISSEEGEMLEMNYTTLGVSNEIGLTYDPYTFSVENTGKTIIGYYELRIVDKEYELSDLPHKALNYAVSINGGAYTEPRNLGDDKSYIYVGGSLAPGESDDFNLKMWVNEEFGKYANNKILKAAIEITLYSDMPTRNYIIYDSQGGSYIPKTNISTKRVSNQVPLKHGFSFLGWSVSPDGEAYYDPNDKYETGIGTTLYADWTETAVPVTYIGNKFATEKSRTINGVTITYDPTTSYLTLNGAPTGNIVLMHLLESLVPSEEYVTSLTYISGNYSSDGNITFTTEVQDSNQVNLSTRYYVDNSLPTNESSTATLVISDSVAQEGSYLKNWIWFSSPSTTVFNDYKVKVNLTKVQTKNIKYGANYAFPSEEPRRYGYTFTGWYTEEIGGTQITTENKVTTLNEHTLYAHWSENDVVAVSYVGNRFLATNKTASSISYTYDPTTSYLTINGTPTASLIFEYLPQTFVEGLQYKLTLEYISGSFTTGSSSGIFAIEPANANKALLSVRNGANTTWPTSTDKIKSCIQTANSTDIADGKYFRLYMYFSTPSQVTFTNYKIKVTVSKVDIKNVPVGESYGALGNTPSREGYTFTGWYTAESGGTQVISETIVTTDTDHTLYAHWTANAVTPSGMTADSCASGRYIYTGTPNNYVQFNNELWRIVAKETNGTWMIMKATPAGTSTWYNNDTTATNYKSSNVRTWLTGAGYSRLSSTAKSQIVARNVYYGIYSSYTSTCNAHSLDRNTLAGSDYVTTLSLSDYLKAGSASSSHWMVQSSRFWLTSMYSTTRSRSIQTTGAISYYTNTSSYSVIPVVYLNSATVFTSGTGTSTNPYIIGS